MDIPCGFFYPETRDVVRIVAIRTLLWMNVQAMNRVWRGDKESYHFMYAVCNI